MSDSTASSPPRSGGRLDRWWALSVLVAGVVVIAVMLWLPEGRIPMHWGADGYPDSWGTRWKFGGVMLLIVLGLAGFLEGIRRWTLGRMPWALANIPDKEYWSLPENDATGRARIADDLALVGAWTMMLLASVTVLVGWSIRNDHERADYRVLILVGGWLVVLMVGMVRRVRFYRDHP
jgi:hypothetical protein